MTSVIKRSAIDIIAKMSSNATTDVVKNLIVSLRSCDTVQAIAAVVGMTTIDVVIPAVAFVGTQLLVRRSERQKKEEVDAHCDEVSRLLSQIAARADESTERLAELVERRTWAWARISGADQAMFGRVVASSVLARLNELGLATNERIDGLLSYIETVLYKLDELQANIAAMHDDIRKIAETISAKYEKSETNLWMMVRSREEEIARLIDILSEARSDAESGDMEAERAIRVARATGDAELLQKTIARLADQQYTRAQAKHIELCREVAQIAYVRGDIAEAESRLVLILRIRPEDMRAINGLGWVYERRGDLGLAEEQFNRALELATNDDASRATALSNLGAIALTRGDLHAAERLHRESLDINVKLGRLEQQATELGCLGGIAEFRDDLDNAEKCYQEVLEISKGIKDQLLQAAALGALGGVAKEQGNIKVAEDLTRNALEIFERYGHTEKQATVLNNLGILAFRRGDCDAAEQSYKRALGLPGVSLELKAGVLSNLGRIEEERGNLDGAVKYYRESLVICRSHGFAEFTANTSSVLGLLLHSRGDLTEAEKLYRETLEIDRKLCRLGRQAVALFQLGEIAMTRRDLDAALAAFQEALAIFRQTDSIQAQASTLKNLGTIAKQRHGYAEARQLWKDSRDLFARIDMPDKVKELQNCLDEIPSE